MIRTAIRNWREQPRELFGLCMVEIWERFGFVTTAGLMVLFLVSPITEQGLGWANADALQLLAWFTAALFTSPMLGGWLADNLLGQKRAIAVGGVLMVLGYLGLGASPYFLDLVGGDTDALRKILTASGLALAQTAPDPAAWNSVISRIAVADGPGGGAVAAFQVVYQLQTVLIIASMALIVAGNALFKPSVSTLVGRLYPAGDPRRDGGFTLFWTCINAGAFLAFVVGGAVSEGLGWNYGFLAASLGMVGGLIFFSLIQRSLPAWIKPVKRPVGVAPEKLTSADRKRLAAILLMTGFAVIFNANHGQIFGLVGLFLLQDVDRTIGSFEVPTLWVTSLNPFIVLLTAPLASVVWDALGRRGRNPSFPMKFAIALLLLAVGQGILMVGALDAVGPGKAALAWVVLAMVALSLAEIPLQPIGLSMVTLLTPARLVSTMIGVWLLNYALGGWIGHTVGALASTYGREQIFAFGAGSCLVAAALLLLLRRRLNSWMSIPDEARRGGPDPQSQTDPPSEALDIRADNLQSPCIMHVPEDGVSRVDALIAGAGPSGLALGIDLLRRGLRVRLIEKRDQPFQASKGKGLQPRTLEVFEDLGVINAVLASGVTYPPMRFYAGHEVIAERPMTEVREPTPDIPYPNLFMVPQWRTEEILSARFEQLGGRIERGVELIGFEQDDGGVRAQVRSAGQDHQIEASYLVGADGAHSLVRGLVGIALEGDTPDLPGLVFADVDVTVLDRDHWHFWAGDQTNVVSLMPLPSTSAFQYMGSIPPEVGELTLQVLQDHLDARSGRTDIRLSNLGWVSRFKPNIRMAQRYRAGRVFLAGDSAHVHPPTGAQGLNTGVQDSYNLAWKLASVIAGAPESLLDTYEEERLPIAAHVLGLSDRLLRVGMNNSLEGLKRGDDERQLGLNYEGSSLCPPSALGAAVRPGDRLPDAILTGGPDGGGQRLFDLVQGGGFTVLSTGGAKAVAGIKVVDVRNRGAEVEALLGGAGRHLVVRPDGYVGGIFATPGETAQYLGRFFALTDAAVERA